MTDFTTARRMMVDGQVRTSDVTDLRIVDAMQDIARERFLSAGRAELAYLDLDAPVAMNGDAASRRLLKPMVLAKLIQAAEIGENHAVLDVGCATGYSAAVLSRLARSVLALEQDPALAQSARNCLREAGASNVTVVTGALVDGWPAGAPFDAILLDGRTEIPPAALHGQLKEGGRLVTVLGGARLAKAMLYRCHKGEISGRPIFDAAAALLPGFAAVPVFVF